MARGERRPQLPKLRRIGVLAVLVGIALAGCGSGGDGNSSPGGQNSAASPPKQGFENAKQGCQGCPPDVALAVDFNNQTPYTFSLERFSLKPDIAHADPPPERILPGAKPHGSWSYCCVREDRASVDATYSAHDRSGNLVQVVTFVVVATRYSAGWRGAADALPPTRSFRVSSRGDGGDPTSTRGFTAEFYISP
jgi:hypothetical protein